MLANHTINTDSKKRRSLFATDYGERYDRSLSDIDQRFI
jgi:hypothetical protein